MATLEMLEAQVQQLSAAEFSQFRSWFYAFEKRVDTTPFEPAEFEDDAWDIQMKQDAETGKLDALIGRALAHRSAGRMKEL